MYNDFMSKKTIMCVDDETDILELLREEFEDCGYKVIEALNGREAFEKFKKSKIDCVISDVRMPYEDGFTLAKNIKSTGSKVPIFLVTGFCDYTSEEFNKLGVNAIIFKPFDLVEVVQMIKNTLKEN